MQMRCKQLVESEIAKPLRGTFGNAAPPRAHRGARLAVALIGCGRSRGGADKEAPPVKGAAPKAFGFPNGPAKSNDPLAATGLSCGAALTV